MSPRSIASLAAALALIVVRGTAAAQTEPDTSGELAATAAEYQAAYDQLTTLAPDRERVATVSGLVLERGAIRLTLGEGTLALASPVAGHTVAAVFTGSGTLGFTPPAGVEAQHLERFYQTPALDQPITSAVLLFTDSTLEQIEAAAALAPGTPDRAARDRTRAAVRYLCDDETESCDPAVLTALLNGEPGYFRATVETGDHGTLIAELSPYRAEPVALLRRARGARGDRVAEVVSMFGDGAAPPADDAEPGVRVTHYRVDTRLERTTWVNLQFSATAELTLRAARPGRRWAWLVLYPELEIDSARWSDGRPATVVKPEKSALLWLALDPPLGAADSGRLTLHYRGDLVEREGEWFFIKTSGAWYPRTGGRDYATFDLTFRSPADYPLASVGRLVEDRTEGRERVSRWVADRPMRNASFNVGKFEEREVVEQGAPPVTLLARGRLTREVGAEVAASLRFFGTLFGPAPVERFYATEIPWPHGEAFPGMIHLSWATFVETAREGYDEVFRAHEVAHQWWGVGVDFATYHDQWLSEGLAQFSGLWYLQTVRRDNKRYFGLLERWRREMFDVRRGLFGKGQEAGPIWLGWRNHTSTTEGDYGVVVYAKAAWVLHMLRVLMLDLNTVNEDRFTALLRDFYTTYRGRRASTEDFRRVAERHAGVDLGWFFDQWVYGTAVPSYRVAYKFEPEGGKYRFKLKVWQENVPDDFVMYVPVTVDLGQGRQARLRVKVEGPVSDIDLGLVPLEPKGLTFNELSGVLCEFKMVKWED